MSWRKLNLVCFVVGFVAGFIWTAPAHGETTYKAEMVSSPNPNEVRVQVSLAEMNNLKGYGFAVNFDPKNYEYVGFELSVENRFSNAALVIGKETEKGLVSVGHVMPLTIIGSVVNGDMIAGTLIFRKTGGGDSKFRLSDFLTLDNKFVARNIGDFLLEDRPISFVLNQNFPNPFNPETQIPYTLASDVETKLMIYNTLGQVVRTLVNEHQAAGRYSIRWDGLDAVGRQVASGTYLYRLEAGSFKTVKKLMLLK